MDAWCCHGVQCNGMQCKQHRLSGLIKLQTTNNTSNSTSLASIRGFSSIAACMQCMDATVPTLPTCGNIMHAIMSSINWLFPYRSTNLHYIYIYIERERERETAGLAAAGSRSATLCFKSSQEWNATPSFPSFSAQCKITIHACHLISIHIFKWNFYIYISESDDLMKGASKSEVESTTVEAGFIFLYPATRLLAADNFLSKRTGSSIVLSKLKNCFIQVLVLLLTDHYYNFVQIFLQLAHINPQDLNYTYMLSIWSIICKFISNFSPKLYKFRFKVPN
jgi:hypothetical protein